MIRKYVELIAYRKYEYMYLYTGSFDKGTTRFKVILASDCIADTTHSSFSSEIYKMYIHQ